MQYKQKPEYRQEAGWSSHSRTASYTSPVSYSTPKQKTVKVMQNQKIFAGCEALVCTRAPTVRRAVSATSLLMRPSVRALRARLTNHMQGTQNLLWGEGKSSKCLSSSDVIKPEMEKHNVLMKAAKRCVFLHALSWWTARARLIIFSSVQPHEKKTLGLNAVQLLHSMLCFKEARLITANDPPACTKCSMVGNLL